ncbi:3'-5' exonuclease [Fulvivirga lutea]|uniref:3'-5' exonuclease n=1 Tax=Fulvivirga lutea TaxID=2810512 RepID=A0A975A1M7_9BACT|nr:3'-5' exonuclease [Fulvivirga lutea]QSE97692.1 3'-5' exonuclease domain-containing protein 2 [Fulvivirga lutea]
MFAATINNDEINELELERFEGNITVVEDVEALKKVVAILQKESALGFDTESKPAFKKGEYNHISLLQFSTENEAYLIRVNKTGITPELKRLLESEKITKVGVALRDDIKDLRKLSPMNPKGFAELNHLVKEIGIESNGLRKLTAIILGFRISKNAQVSNWEKEELTEKQIYYAATDAWVCIKMYNKLVKQGWLEAVSK